MKKQNSKTPLLLIVLLLSAIVATLSFQLYSKEIELSTQDTNTTNVTQPIEKDTTDITLEDIYKPIEEIWIATTDENNVMEIPSEFTKLSNPEGTGYFNIAPDGGMTSSYIYTSEDVFAEDNVDELNTYYVETFGPSPCWAKELDGETCNEPITQDFYGPFEGKLAQMLK